MHTKKNRLTRNVSIFTHGLAAIAIASMLAVGGRSYADDGVSMAPPVGADAQDASASGSDVFNWSDVPSDQRVPLTRVVFDRSGYQLYDTVGETILVPFTNDNLYVMKFAVSPDGTTYFENLGNEPILYLPRDGYLINNAAGGARWYPFTNGFDPATPVFLGCAPSWDDFCDMGWYPGMVIYGGYWCNGPFFSIGAVFPCDGFLIDIGFNHFAGWGHYWGYVHDHPAPYHTYFAANDFRRYDHIHNSRIAFRGAGSSYARAGHGFGGAAMRGHAFRGAISSNGAHGYSHSFSGGHQFASSGAHQFRGAQGGTWHSGHQATMGQIHSNSSFGSHGMGGFAQHSFSGGGAHFSGGGAHFSGGGHAGGGHFGGGGGGHHH